MRNKTTRSTYIKKTLTFSYDPQHCLFGRSMPINVHLTQKDSLGMYAKFCCINPCRVYLLKGIGKANTVIIRTGLYIV